MAKNYLRVCAAPMLAVLGSGTPTGTTFKFAFDEEADVWQGDDSSVSLLQLKVNSQGLHGANASRIAENPGNLERQKCPHEIEEEKEASTPFGCSGTLSASDGTKECSIWGEPHMSRSWLSNLPFGGYDVMFKAGLFRMAAAADGSWEVQVYNCGVWTGSVAMRFGKDVLEVVAIDKTSPVLYYLNGKQYNGPWPLEKGKLYMDNKNQEGVDANQHAVVGAKGACVDGPGGQIQINIVHDQAFGGNLNLLMEAAEGSFTTRETDKFSLCNIGLSAWEWKWHDWPVELVQPQDSLFIGSGNLACAYCKNMPNPWKSAQAQDREVAERTCESQVPKSAAPPTAESECEKYGIPLANAEAACAELKDDETFFHDCQLDFCAADGNPGAVAGAVEEEHAENPQPKCALVGGACDPAAACCNALKEQAILNFGSVLTNDLCGGGELRYGSVLTQHGQTMDLVVSVEGEHNCGRATNDRNGAKNDALGVIAVQAGREASFSFSFVASGTNTPVTPSSLMFSFLDLDQGKKGKQRESVEVCGAVNAVVTDNTELEQSSKGDCIKFTSTTWGTGQDNPAHPEQLSKTQRARTVAYQVAGSSFTATLGVSERGSSPRKFMFAGHPSVACVLQ